MRDFRSANQNAVWRLEESASYFPEIRQVAVHLLALTVLLLLLGVFAFRSGTFFSSDTGLRFVQVSELVTNGWRSLAVDYQGRVFDPLLAHTPYYFAYAVVEGEIFLSISPFFPLAASFFYAVLGRAGLAVVPVMGAVLAAMAIYRLGKLSGLVHSRALLWITVLATPLLFYSLELWDHTLGGAFACWALYGVASGIQRERHWPLLLGGVVMGLGLGQRPELYPFAGALGAAIVIVGWSRWRRLASYAVGGLMGAAPVYLVQYWWVGHPLGIPMAENAFGYGARPVVNSHHVVGRTEWLRVTRFLAHVEAGMLLPFAGTMLVIAGTVFLLLALWRVERRLLVAGLLPLAVGYLILAYRGLEAPITGVLTTLPLAPLALAYVRNPPQKNRKPYLTVLWTTFLFLALMLAFWPGEGGKQWGARYLLPVYPLAVYLAWYGYDTFRERAGQVWRRALNAATLLLIILGVSLQASGVVHLYRSHREQVPMRDTLATLEADVVLSNRIFFGSEMASLEEKVFLYVDGVEVPVELVGRLRAEGVQRVVLVSSRERPLSLPEEVEVSGVQAVTPEVQVYEFGDE